MSRKKKLEKQVIESLTIEKIAAEGNGLGYFEGKVVFVPRVIPGDVVTVQVVKKKRDFFIAKLIKIEKESPFRLKPLCEHFGICGGCTWQILPYEKQLEFKQQQVEDQLIRIGHLPLPSISPIIGSQNIQFYRNKLEFTFSNKRWFLENEKIVEGSDYEKDSYALGFHIPGMFSKVLDIKQCVLQEDPSNAIRNFVRDYSLSKNLSYFDIVNHTGLLRNIIIRISYTTKEIMVIIVAGAAEREDYDIVKEKGKSKNRFYPYLSKNDKDKVVDLLDAIIEKFPQVTSAYYVANDKGNDTMATSPIFHHWGKKFITETMDDLVFIIGPKSFYQTNSPQAYKLYSLVKELAQLSKDEIVYDLYTGTGTIALFVAKDVKKVVGIEYVEQAIEDAKLNAKENGIDNATFFAGDMKDVLNQEFISNNGNPDVIILDPPRGGIDKEVADVILNARPKRIIYVSCNPATQGRDLSILSKEYNIEAVQPVDMFPHTQHVENIVALKLK